jgi:hypothetical protein
MRDDLLKEQLTSYARTAADAAAQPDAAAIHRRARRHYRRVAALTVAGVLLAVGLGVGLGLGRGDGTPTVDQPRPMPTLTRPAPVPSTAPATSRLPGTFVGDLGGRVVVVSTRTGKVVRTLYGPHPFGTDSYTVGTSPDQTTVYFSHYGGDPCAEPGVFRVPAAGGRPVRVVDGENPESMIKVSADGSRLAYVSTPCPSTGQLDVVVRDAAGRLVRRWPAASAGAGLSLDGVSLSPDGRRVAVGVTNQELILVGVRLLDVDRDRSIADGRLIKAPDPGCDLVVAEFQPRTGRLAAFERCVRTVSGGIARERFRLVYLDPGSGRQLSRSFAFNDPGNDMSVSSLDFDQSGRHLLYQVGSANPTDYERPRPVTGTWRWSGDRPVRIDDDRTVGTGQTSQGITTGNPSW